MKLSNLLRTSAENTYLSDRVFTSGYNNVGGGCAARLIGYTASTKTIRLIALQDHHYGDNGAEWSADLYHEGDTIYISTGSSDYKEFQKKTIVSISPNTTTTTVSGTSYVTLNYIDIVLDSEISMYTDNTTISDTQSFDPTNIFYQFQANALSDATGRPMCRLTLTASALKCLPGTKVAIYHENTEITAFSQSWSGDTLTITFNSSQASTPTKQFYLVSKVNGLEATTQVAIVKDNSFSYTVHMDGENMLVSGTNASACGNGNVVAGDFSTTEGLHNTNLSMNGSVSGAENNIGEGSGNIVKGIGNVVVGRDNMIFGSRNVTVKDSNLLIGGLHKSVTMNNVGIGFNIGFFAKDNITAGYNFGVGDLMTFACSDSSMIGRDLVCRADHAVLVGQHGELPTLEGDLSPVTESYSSGDKEGIHYKAALAFATGLGPSESSNKKRLSMIFSKYKWTKNPAYPYGTGDSSVVCPDVVGAGSGITAATLRSKTTEDPIVLEDYPLLSISGNVMVDGSILSKKLNVVTATQPNTQVVIDPQEATAVKLIFQDSGGVLLSASDHWPECTIVRLYTVNAGVNLQFTGMRSLGNIPTFASEGYDFFELFAFDGIVYFRHLGSFSTNTTNTEGA